MIKVHKTADAILFGLVAAHNAAAKAGRSAQGQVSFSLYDFREVDATGDVANIAANGGILASDSTPIMRGDAANSAEISWATGNVDPVGCQLALPADFGGASDVTLELWVSSGTTDDADIAVGSGWDGAAEVTDTAAETTRSATIHKITATIAAADVPDAAANLTLRLTPPTHATDTIQLHGARLLYTRSVVTAYHYDATASDADPTGDYTTPAESVLAVAAADASDLPTLITVSNEIKATYTEHIKDADAHVLEDFTNNPIAAADASDLATSQTLLNEVKADLNTHHSQAGIHPLDDTVNTIASPDGTNQATSETLANEIKADLNAHIASQLDASAVLIKLV